MATHNDIKEDLTYNKSKFKNHVENPDEEFCLCIVIPFRDYAKEDEIYVNDCRKLNNKYFYDEILISKKDFEKLVEKSRHLKTLRKI